MKTREYPVDDQLKERPRLSVRLSRHFRRRVAKPSVRQTASRRKPSPTAPAQRKRKVADWIARLRHHKSGLRFQATRTARRHRKCNRRQIIKIARVMIAELEQQAQSIPQHKDHLALAPLVPGSRVSPDTLGEKQLGRRECLRAACQLRELVAIAGGKRDATYWSRRFGSDALAA